jgi:hypothetical protein
VAGGIARALFEVGDPGRESISHEARVANTEQGLSRFAAGKPLSPERVRDPIEEEIGLTCDPSAFRFERSPFRGEQARFGRRVIQAPDQTEDLLPADAGAAGRGHGGEGVRFIEDDG